jgi:hypothetical protein
MPIIAIHIGIPRTGTTTIQKNILNLSKNHIAIQKNPYGSSGNSKKANKQTTADNIDISKLLDSLEGREVIFREAIMLPVAKLAVDPNRSHFKRALLSAATQLVRKTNKQIIISSERLCDTSASLRGDSRHDPTGDKCFGIIPLASTLKDANLTPLIITCLRSPIPYLRSKWIRTAFQRKFLSLRQITPNEYIQKQVKLETNYPNTSVLSHAMHAQFIKLLQKYTFVKAFGFQELLESKDVFSLMGLQGEEKYAFQDFPRENKLPFSKEQEQKIEIEITESLKQYGFYDRIMKAQIYE